MDFPLVAPTTIIIVMMFILFYHLGRRLEKVQSMLDGAGDLEHDNALYKKVDEALKGLHRHHEKLENEKRELPQIDLREIDRNPNWQQDLIIGAEKLRSLIAIIDGWRSRDYYAEREAINVPMNLEFAQELAELAHLHKDLSIKEVEWQIKKLSLLGAMRMRDVNFTAIMGDELELRNLENDIQHIRQNFSASEQRVLKAFRQARDSANSVQITK